MQTSVFQDKTILIVDDDPDVLTALSTAFVDCGASVTTANDGNEALQRVDSDKPDLVVLDAMLPKRSGFLVLERLRAKKAPGEKPRVIMITGNQGKRHQSWAQTLGVDEYLNNPFRMERLIESAETLLGGD